MVALLISIVVFVIATLVLVKSADLFTDSAEFFGVKFGISPFVIGITFVAFGTSLPELISAIIAVISGTPDVVVGNVLGSNITNVFLVLGLTAAIASRIKITYEIGRVDLPLVFASAAYLLLVLIDGRFTYFEALIGLFGGAIFLVYSITSAQHHVDRVLEREAKKEVALETSRKESAYYGVMFVVGAILLYFSSSYVVSSLNVIAQALGVSEAVLAAGALALGTSLPELAVSLQAVRHGDAEIAVGNVLGSTIVNSFIVLSIPKLFGEVTVPAVMITTVLPIMLVSTLLFFFMTQDREITRWEGYVLLLFYLLFVGTLLGIVA